MIETNDNFTYIETNESINFKAKKPNNKGFIINISFTKNEDEHKESMSVIKEFFVREIF